MPAIVAWIIQGLAAGTAHMVWKALGALGIGFVTFTGVGALLDGAEAKIFQIMGTMGPQAMALYGVLQIGTCIKIVFAALAMRATIFGMTDGNIRKMVQS